MVKIAYIYLLKNYKQLYVSNNNLKKYSTNFKLYFVELF